MRRCSIQIEVYPLRREVDEKGDHLLGSMPTYKFGIINNHFEYKDLTASGVGRLRSVPFLDCVLVFASIALAMCELMGEPDHCIYRVKSFHWLLVKLHFCTAPRLVIVIEFIS